MAIPARICGSIGSTTQLDLSPSTSIRRLWRHWARYHAAGRRFSTAVYLVVFRALEKEVIGMRMPLVWMCCFLPVVAAYSQLLAASERPVVAGITTTRLVPGQPYELAGNRIVFANWYYVQPGDLDWRNVEGKSVYVRGDEGLFDATHVGIHAPRGIRIQAEKPHVVGPIDRPHRMILKDGAVFKGWTDSDYFESKDGLQWEQKARLKLDPIVKDGFYQVFIDPSAKQEERYKALWVGQIQRDQFDAFRAKRPGAWEPRAIFLLGEKDDITTIRGGVSADGIDWHTLPDPLVAEYCDTWNTGYYDRVLSEYVIYTRYWSVGPRSDRVPPDIRGSWTGVGRRAIGRTASRDFRTFTPSEMILEPTPEMLPSEQLYTNCHTTVPGAPDQHLMFPTIWNGSVDDTTRVAFASSHDGKVWHWVPGGDLLQTGSFGRWDGGCIWATPDLIELPNGDWALPYLGHNLPHKYPRGKLVGTTAYAVWPKGRLVALEASHEGEFTMIPIIAPGKVLKINAVTLRTGWVKVEVLGTKGRSIAESIPIVGDQHWTQVKWKDTSDLGVEVGQPITIRLQLKHAKIYGLQFDPN